MADTTTVADGRADEPSQRDLSAEELERRLAQAVKDAVAGRCESDLSVIRERIRRKRENL
jgi:hypothetical protein